MTGRSTLLALAALCATGCIARFSPKHPVHGAPLPEEGARYRAFAAARMPAQNARLVADLEAAARVGGLALTPEEFDRRFRQNGRNYGALGGVEGVDKLRYPETGHPAAAFSYVQMGIRFEARGQPGAASRAYWAALGLTGRTVGSRRQREEIRQAAYAGLARLAQRRGHTEWAALLRLCAELAGTYVRSDQAAEQHAAFYGALREQIQVQERIEEERARARRGVILQAISAGVGAATTVAQGAAGGLNPDAYAQQMGTHLSSAIAAGQQSQEIDAATREAMAELSSSVGQLREIAAEDVPDIEAGKDFVARQVAWYLAAAADPMPYVRGPLLRFARRRPPLAHRLHGFEASLVAQQTGTRATATPVQTLTALATGLLEAERHVATFERFGIVPGPRYLAAVCAPGSGHDVACDLAAREVCRAGIHEGCGVLAAIYAAPAAAAEPAPAAAVDRRKR